MLYSMARKGLKAMYELTNGEVLDLSRLASKERSYLDELAADAAKGAAYFDLLLRVKGPGALPSKGGMVTSEVLTSTVYRVAQDIVQRVGIVQGKLRPPSDAAPAQLLSVPEAARLVGVTRQALNDAIARDRLPAQRVGGTFVLKLDDVRAYRAAAEQRPAPGRRARKA
jgi:excisionase family DNA binding protein